MTLDSNVPSSPENGPQVHPENMEGGAGPGGRAVPWNVTSLPPQRVNDWFFRLFLVRGFAQ